MGTSELTMRAGGRTTRRVGVAKGLPSLDEPTAARETA